MLNWKTEAFPGDDLTGHMVRKVLVMTRLVLMCAQDVGYHIRTYSDPLYTLIDNLWGVGGKLKPIWLGYGIKITTIGIL